MPNLREIAQLISLTSFAWYGTSCFLSKRMALEFQRYEMDRYRKLTGALQIAGSIGLTLGFFSTPLLQLSAASLAAMMLVAVFVRIKIRDPLYAKVPAFLFFVLNLFIVFAAEKKI